MTCESPRSDRASGGTGDLPLELVSFVGRMQELADVRGLVDRHRLVTLTGPGGIGKTRLAVEAARGGRGMVQDRCRLVDLTIVVNQATLLDALAIVLSVRETGHRSLSEGIVARLTPDRVLLILDNCEHVLDDCLATAEFLLQRCPLLNILATSREPLGLPGEVPYHVPPLPERDAIRLFVERAGRRVTLEEGTAPAVAEICRRLDGLPLAIELAAARVGFLSPEEIAARLDDCSHLLTGGPRGAPARQRTLAATLDWSHDLLSPAERLVFRRLSVFSGGFELEAAEAVCPGDDVERHEVLHLIGRLVAQSLVVCQEQEARTRYRLLETVRQFARDRLGTAREEERVVAAHTEWCLRLVERAEENLIGPEQTSWLKRLEAEQANVTSVLEASLLAGESETALRLAGPLVVFWMVRGRLREGLGILERCLSSSAEEGSRHYLTVLWGAGFFASLLGDFERATSIGEKCRDLARTAGNAVAEGRALNLLGFVGLLGNRPADASSLLEQSLEPARRGCDLWCEASSLGLLGFAEVFRSEFAAAAPYFARSLAVSSNSGDDQGRRMALIGTGYVAVQRGAYELARNALEEGLSSARRVGDLFWTAVALAYLTELGRVRGDHAAAASCGEEAVAAARETGSPPLLGFCLAFDGRAAFARMDVKMARAQLEEALALPMAGGNPGNAGIASITLAEMAIADDEPTIAASLIDQGVALARQSGDRLVIAGSLLTDARFARRFGDPRDALARAHSALELSATLGHLPSLASALDLLAGLAAADDHLEHAARLFGAADGLRDRAGFTCSQVEWATRQDDLAALSASLPPPVLDAARQQGTGLGPEEALAYAQRGRGPRRRPATGWESLTPAEQEVVRLAIDGLTNAEIGTRLYVSPRTVQTHLAHVFVKLGVRSRRELPRAVPPVLRLRAQPEHR